MQTGELRILGDEVLILSSPTTVYRVRSGEAALFVVELDDRGNPSGRRSFIGAARPGEILIGTSSVNSGGITLTLIAVGVVPTIVDPWDLKAADAAQRDEALRRYLATLVDSDADEVDLRRARPVQPPNSLDLEADEHAHSSHRLAYVRIAKGRASLLDAHHCDARTGIVPLHGRLTLRAHGSVRVDAIGGAAVHPDDVAQGIEVVHAAFWKRWQARAAEEEKRREAMRRATQAFDERALQSGLEEATHLFERDQITTEPGDDPIVAAARIVAAADGTAIVAPRVSHSDSQAAVQAIAIESRLSFRRVRLRAGWQKREHGPLLAFRGAAQTPVALLPHHGRARYLLVDPARCHETVRVDAALASEIAPTAYLFLRPFPERPVGVWDLLRFGLRHSGIDVSQILLFGFLGGVLAGTVPLATAILYSTIIPGAMRAELFTMGLALLAIAVTAAVTEVVRGLTIVRLQAHVGSTLQSAVMERLLALPASFFRRYQIGDLADRLMGVDRIEQYVSDITISAALSGVFSLVSFALLFIYDTGLAWLCALLALVAIGAAIAEAVATLSLRRQIFDRYGSIAGFVLQIFNGISKLRIARAETRAFVGWLHRFVEMRRMTTRVGTIVYRFGIFSGIWPAVTTLAIIGYIFIIRHGDFPAATFIAASAAFGQLLGSLLGLGDAFVQVIRIIPIYERARPLLRELPEILEAHGDPGVLSGAIEVRNLSFRYENASSQTLDRLDLKIDPGAFVAIVGPSGSGKSTLFRLLLGFEKPDHGSVLYDGHDLATVDLAAVRRQIGSVLQSTGALQGSIFENIAGARYISHDQAWDAARRVGIADDIAKLPMQLETYIGSDGGGLSTGQRQRIAIARAIVTSPRILLFDEATSALDNETQAIVMKTLEQLDATRIVIAHRLSTIQNADRIVVIEGGRIVQDGTYADLVETAGPFSALAKRQSI